ncbi:sigma-70 family RNA polymerase sigma factor [Alkalihalobacillus sp. CinArs1]|uniref:sigma-70 family RNA polymerase sigma factor n=1 Tax=Alkalihalobacillus sp. CinArs1 TaxID=2995314 RepID=UPI0022DE22DE|nr:sigma-70 family RNA polymerase sigma factor [Alkalihalobacillus sp. CinArs1]
MEDHEFEVLVTQYTPLIKSQIAKLRLTKNYAYYEQMAMIALWECATRYDASKGSFSSFAYVKIRGALIDEIRREATRSTRFVSSDDITEFPSAETSVRSEYELSHYLSLLTSNQRKWIELSLAEELSVSDIAMKEGVTVEAVKSWRKRAIMKLRKALQ